MKIKKVCVITCYAQPDYVRARTIRAALRLLPDVEVIVVKNTHKGLLRYPEVFWKVFVTRITRRPDIYLQTFRAYESFPFIRLITMGKKFIFDEFINPIEQVAYENHYIKPGGVVATIAQWGYKFWVKTVTLIITDTPSHAAYSAKLMKLPIKKYVPLIVSSDEDVFTVNKAPEKSNNDPFTVFYYGLFMTPLQGLDTILAAAVLLKDQAVRFVLLGGKESTQEKIQLAQESGANVVYKRFVPYDALPGYMANADICLGGPFGGTVQAQYVIGGKTYQYMNMGRPVLIGKNEESHIWTDKKDALIVEQANAQALADAIIWAKTHPTEVVKIGKAGRELYEMKLSNAVLAGQLRSLLARKELS